MPHCGVPGGFVMLQCGSKCRRPVQKEQSASPTGPFVHRTRVMRRTIRARLWITLIECSAQKLFPVEIPGLKLFGNPSRIVPMASITYSVRMM